MTEASVVHTLGIDNRNIIPPPEKLPGADDQAGWVREHWDKMTIENFKRKYSAFRDFMYGADLETDEVEVLHQCHSLMMTRELLHTIARSIRTNRPASTCRSDLHSKTTWFAR